MLKRKSRERKAYLEKENDRSIAIIADLRAQALVCQFAMDNVFQVVSITIFTTCFLMFAFSMFCYVTQEIINSNRKIEYEIAELRKEINLASKSTRTGEIFS